MQQKFKIKENGFAEIRKQLILRLVSFGLIVLCGLIVYIYILSTNQSGDINTLPFILPIIIGAVIFGLLMGLRRQKSIFNSYELTIDDQKIVRKQNITSDITIYLNEIEEIKKIANGALIINAGRLNKTIIVPAQLENIETLESKLSDFNITTAGREKSVLQSLKWPLSVLTIVLMLVLYLSTNKILISISGILLTAGLIYSQFAIQKSKHIDNRTKRGAWISLIVIIIIVWITYIKVFGT